MRNQVEEEGMRAGETRSDRGDRAVREGEKRGAFSMERKESSLFSGIWWSSLQSLFPFALLPLKKGEKEPCLDIMGCRVPSSPGEEDAEGGKRHHCFENKSPDKDVHGKIWRSTLIVESPWERCQRGRTVVVDEERSNIFMFRSSGGEGFRLPGLGRFVGPPTSAVTWTDGHGEAAQMEFLG